MSSSSRASAHTGNTNAATDPNSSLITKTAIIDTVQSMSQRLSGTTLIEPLHNPASGNAAADAIYIYEFSDGSATYTGLLALTPLENLTSGEINVCQWVNKNDLERFNQDFAGTVILAYTADQKINCLINKARQFSPLEVSETSGQYHKFWAISDGQLMDQLTKAFDVLGTVLLIGQHQIGKQRGKAGHQLNFGSLGLSCPDGHFSSLYIATDQLRSYPCHQLLKPGLSVDPEDFLRIISQNFEIINSPGNLPVEPFCRHQFGLNLQGKWYRLLLNQEVLAGAPFSERLDGNILYEQIIYPARLFPGSATGICSIGGPDALKELLDRLRQDPLQIAFTLYPASLNQAMSLAYIDGCLPPGMMWIGPDLASGSLTSQPDSALNL